MSKCFQNFSIALFKEKNKYKVIASSLKTLILKIVSEAASNVFPAFLRSHNLIGRFSSVYFHGRL
jgi:hypothetical protein